MSVGLARKLNRLGYSVSHDGDKGWIIVRKEKAALESR